MDKGEKLFSNLPKQKRGGIKISAFLGIIFAVVGISFSMISYFVNNGFSILSIQGLIFGPVGAFFSLKSLSKEFCVYEKGIQVPTTFWRRFYRFNEIEYIHLNARRVKETWEIEIKARDEPKITYPKKRLNNWEEFYEFAEDYLIKKIQLKGLK